MKNYIRAHTTVDILNILIIFIINTDKPINQDKHPKQWPNFFYRTMKKCVLKTCLTNLLKNNFYFLRYYKINY